MQGPSTNQKFEVKNCDCLSLFSYKNVTFKLWILKQERFYILFSHKTYSECGYVTPQNPFNEMLVGNCLRFDTKLPIPHYVKVELIYILYLFGKSLAQYKIKSQNF